VRFAQINYFSDVREQEVDRATAEQLLRKSMASSPLDGVQFIPVDTLDGPAYDFDPQGWWLYMVTRQNECRVGGTEYVAIHPDSGNIRNLGRLGE
jgi:hypothetical protein